VANDVGQKNADRMNENIVVTNGTCTWLSGNVVTVEANLTNAGSVAAQLINLWVFDTSKQTYGFNNSIASTSESNMNPGHVLYLVGMKAIRVTVPDASPGDSFNSWFVTARGNTVPVTVTKGIIVAQVAQGIGSITMEFKTFRYYVVPANNSLGKAFFNFTIPGDKDTVFGIYLTNLDETKKNINLTRYSCVWLIIPGSSTSQSWSIAKVVSGRLVAFDFQVLEYGEPTLVYFGKTKASNLKGNIAAVNILLYGKIGSDDYGQNLPFISVYVTP